MPSVGSITVELNLDSSKLTSGLKSAVSQLESFGSQVSGIEGKLSGLGDSSAFSKIGSSITSALKVGAVAGIAAIGTAVVGAGIKAREAAQDFEVFEYAVAKTASMSGKLGAAFEAQKAGITEVAQLLGKDTVFSSLEAAQAMYSLASAGYDVVAMGYEGLLPFLDLAAGTQSDLTDTTKMMSATLAIFGLGLSDTGRVADVYARSISMSQATMEKLTYSMSYAGPTADMLGMSIEEVTAALSVLYNGGLQGQKAGTGLRGVFASLLKPTQDADSALAEMGLTMEDLNPMTYKFSEIIQTLADHNLNAEQSFKIFGRTAAPAIGILVQGAADVKRFEDNLYAAGGAANTLATQQMDTLHGSIEQLQGDLENLSINIGAKLAPSIRNSLGALEDMMPEIEKFALGVVDYFLDMSEKLGSSIASIKKIGSTLLKIFIGIFADLSGTGAGSGVIHVINKMFTDIASTIEDAAPAIELAVIKIITIIRDTFNGLGPSVDNIKSIVRDIINVFTALFSGITGSASVDVAGTISGTINAITGVLAGLSSAISSKILELAPGIKKAFTAIIEAVAWFINNFGTISTAVRDKFDEVVLVLGMIPKELSPAFDAVRSVFETGLKIILDSVGDGSGIKAKLKEIWDNLPQIIAKAIKDLGPLWSLLNDAFVFFGGVIEGFIENIGPSWDNIKSIFDSAVQILKQIAKDIGAALANMFKEAGGAEGGKELGKSIAETINKITKAVAGLMKWLENNPKVVEFGLAMVALAIAAGAVLITIVKLLIPIFSLISTLGSVIVMLEFFGAGWTGLGAILSFLGAKIFPNTTKAVLYLSKNLGPLAKAILPALGRLFTGTGRILLNVGSKILPILIKAFTSVGGLLLRIATVVIPPLISVLSAIGAPILIAVGLIALLAAAWYYNWGGIREKTYAAVDFIKAQWDRLKIEVAKIGPAFSAAKVTIIGVWDGIKASIAEKISGIIAVLAGWVSSLALIWVAIKLSIDAMKVSFLAKWDEIKLGISDKANAIKTVLSGFSASLKSEYDAAILSLENLKASLMEKWDSIKLGIQTKIDEVVTSITGWYTKLQGEYDKSTTSLESLKTSLEEKWEAIKTGIKEKIDALQLALESWNTNLGTLYSTVTAALEGLKTSLTDKWDALKTAISDIATSIYEAIQTWHSNLKTTYSELITSITDLYTQLTGKWDEIKLMVATKVNEILESIKSWLANLKVTFLMIVAAVVSMKDNAVRAFTEMKTQVAAKLEEIKKAILDKLAAVKATATKWYEAGVSIAQGLINGLTSKLSAVKSAAAALWDATKTGVTNLVKTVTTPVAAAVKKHVSLIAASTTSVSDRLPHSPAKKGPFRKLPNWKAVIPGNMPEGVALMEGLVRKASTLMVQMKSPLVALGKVDASPTISEGNLLKSNAVAKSFSEILGTINNVNFGGFENSIDRIITKMQELISASYNMNNALKEGASDTVNQASNYERAGESLGDALASGIKFQVASVKSATMDLRNASSILPTYSGASSGYGTANMRRYGAGATNVKISTINNNGSSLALSRLKTAGI